MSKILHLGPIDHVPIKCSKLKTSIYGIPPSQYHPLWMNLSRPSSQKRLAQGCLFGVISIASLFTHLVELVVIENASTTRHTFRSKWYNLKAVH